MKLLVAISVRTIETCLVCLGIVTLQLIAILFPGLPI